MNLFKMLFSLMSIFSEKKSKSSHGNCITFTIGDGTDCQFMCDHCSQYLGTNDFFFTDWICQNKNGYCVGNPIPWEEYTCCSNE